MKKIILGIIIGITLSLGTITFASSAIKLVMIPEYISGYKTTDLLEYVAKQKAVSDIYENKKIEKLESLKKINAESYKRINNDNGNSISA